jgi:hypothetical protein
MGRQRSSLNRLYCLVFDNKRRTFYQTRGVWVTFDIAALVKDDTNQEKCNDKPANGFDRLGAMTNAIRLVTRLITGANNPICAR